MKEGHKLKRDTELIIISVIILTIVTLNVSYSAFFDVKSKTTVQQISTGTLNVIIDSSSTKINETDLYPTSDSELPTSANATVSGSFAKLVLINNGTLDADYSISLSRDVEALAAAGKTEADAVSPNYIKIGVYDATNSEWVNFGSGSANVYYVSLAGLTPTDGKYPILRKVLSANETQNESVEYRVYVWLDENIPTEEIGNLVYLKLDVKSATVNGRVES